MMLIGAGGALIFTLMAWKQGQAVLSADFLRPTIIIRNLGEVIGTLGFVTALVLTLLVMALVGLAEVLSRGRPHG